MPTIALDIRTTTRLNRLTVVAIALLSLISSAHAETPDSARPSYYRFSISEGINTLGLGDNTVGLGLRLSYAVQHGEELWSGAISAQTSEFVLFNVPRVTLAEFAGLYGRGHTERWMHYTYSGGAAIMYAERRGNPISSSGWFGPNFATIPSWGVAALGELQGIVTPLPFLGIGATVIASVNTFRPYLAVMITLQVGDL